MRKVTIADLRDRVAELIEHSLELHRNSRASQESGYERPSGRATDEEVSDFLASNPLLDGELAERLIDEGPLGFVAMGAEVSGGWLSEFEEHVSDWSRTNAWLGADAPLFVLYAQPEPTGSELWRPNVDGVPIWLPRAPACMLLARELLSQGRPLSELHWKEFENLVGELLEAEGWEVVVTRSSRDGGIDVVAELTDPVLGAIKSLWQAKKYGPSRKVQLSHVRELSAIRDDHRATKGMIITTGSLTRGALDWIKRDTYGLGYKDGPAVQRWLTSLAD